MSKLEYIASGTNYLYLRAIRNSDGDALKYLQSKLGDVKNHTDHKFGILYNAYTETKFSDVFIKYKDHIDSIYSDSGGLQLVTQGKKVTEDLKKIIYENQGNFSNFAMSFDENPVGLLSDKSLRTDVTTRFFDKDLFETAAKNTGINIRNQIETFLKLDSDTKPIFIAQGNCYDTYMKWAEIALSQIPKDLQSRIGGVALGATAIGYGHLEDIERAAYFKFLPIQTKHIHVLGVGSIRRLLPYLIFRYNGFYGDDTHISYDSTTHTAGSELGNFFSKEEYTMKFNRQFGSDYVKIFEDMKEIYSLDRFDVSDFHEIMNNGLTKYTKVNGKDEFDHLDIRICFILKSIINFCNCVDRIKDDKKLLIGYIRDKKIYGLMNFLFSVKDKDSFDYWLQHAKRHIKTKKVNRQKPSNLEDLFS